MAVHFTGPVLFAGKDGQRKWFENLPIDKNPDYVVYMDDFTGVALDNTNDWTVVKDSSATAALGADAESGTLVLTSQQPQITTELLCKAMKYLLCLQVETFGLKPKLKSATQKAVRLICAWV